jgi:PAS domain S-box-containing protein
MTNMPSQEKSFIADANTPSSVFLLVMITLLAFFALAGAHFFYNVDFVLLVAIFSCALAVFSLAHWMGKKACGRQASMRWSSVPAVVVEIDFEGKILFANKGFDGGSGSVLEGANLYRLNVVRRNPSVKEALEKITAHEPAIEFDAGEYFVRIALKAGGKRIVVMFTEFVDRGAAESSDRIQEICIQEYFDSSEDLLSIVDNQTANFVYFNKAWSRLLGYDDAELQKMSVLALMHPSGADNHVLPIAEFENFFSRNIAKTGEVVWLTWGSQPSKIGRYIYITARNVSDQRRAEIGLSVSQKELERHQYGLEKLVDEQTADIVKAKITAEKATEAKSEFLANMSHELRTPLHAIVGFTNMGINEVGVWNAEQTMENYLRIMNSGERLLLLLDNLLDLSKFEFGMMELNVDPHRMLEMTEHVKEGVHSLLEKKSITITIKCEHTKAVECDRLRVEQVLMNLLSNAIKFSPVGSEIIVRISEGVVRQGRRQLEAVNVDVIDGGIGLPSGEEQKIFARFVQSSKTASDAGGTGLGLSICKQIISLHGGEISAKSNRATQDGACFTFLLPLKTLFQRG